MGRFAAVDGWVYTRPCRMKKEDVLLRVLKSTTFVPDTEKCPFLWLFLLRYLLMKPWGPIIVIGIIFECDSVDNRFGGYMGKNNTEVVHAYSF